MSKFIVELVNTTTGKVLNTEDEVFDTEQEAEYYRSECSSNYSEGADVLEQCGRPFDDSGKNEYVVTEID